MRWVSTKASLKRGKIRYWEWARLSLLQEQKESTQNNKCFGRRRITFTVRGWRYSSKRNKRSSNSGESAVRQCLHLVRSIPTTTLSPTLFLTCIRILTCWRWWHSRDILTLLWLLSGLKSGKTNQLFIIMDNKIPTEFFFRHVEKLQQTWPSVRLSSFRRAAIWTASSSSMERALEMSAL